MIISKAFISRYLQLYIYIYSTRKTTNSSRRLPKRQSDRWASNGKRNVWQAIMWRRSRNRHDAYRKFLKSVRSPRRQRPSPLTTRCAAGHVRPDRYGLTGGDSARFFHALLADVQIIIIIYELLYEVVACPSRGSRRDIFPIRQIIIMIIIISAYFLHTHARHTCAQSGVCVKRTVDYCSKINTMTTLVTIIIIIIIDHICTLAFPWIRSAAGSQNLLTTYLYKYLKTKNNFLY